MLKPRKKFTKKELKQDKFVLFTLEAEKFIKEKSGMLLRTGLILVAVVLLVGFYVRSKSSANREAQTMLGEINISLSLNKKDQAIKQLKTLVDRYEGTFSASQGSFLLAKLYYDDGKIKDAATYFKKYIDEYSDDDILTPSALAGYADCLYKQKKYDQAALYYEKAYKSNKDFPEAAAFLYSAALSYRDAGDKAKAAEAAKKVVQEFKDSPYKSRAELLIEELKIKV